MAVLRALRRNPVLFVPVLASTFVRLPELLVERASPVLAGVLAPAGPALLVFVTPFFHAGLVGMADEALDGTTTLGTFVRAGRANYLSMLAGYLLLFAVNSVLAVTLLVGGGVGALVFLGSDQPGPGTFVVVGALVALPLLAYLLVLFFLQFYGHAIVLDGAGVADGFRRSASLVRRHLPRTLAYSVLGGVVGVLFAAGVVVSYFLLVIRSPPPVALPPTGWSVGGTAVGVAAIVGLQTLLGGAFATYSVAFYRTITD